MKNFGASVQSRLKNLSIQTGIDMPTLLRRYVQERLLYRLSISSEAENFVLKGGLLLAAYNEGVLLRPTEDVDLNGILGHGNVELLRAALIAVLSSEAPDDGVKFMLDTMRIKKDREGIVPGGKIVLLASVGTAKVELKVDVGFGNPVTPETRMIEFPTLLDGITPRPVMSSYPLETVIAEKLHAMAQFGQANTRFKDYYDILYLSRQHSFSADTLSDALETTFSHQRREIPETFSGLSPRFAIDGERGWNAFMSKLPGAQKCDLATVVADIADFVNPIVECARSGSRNGATWSPGTGWLSYYPAP